MTTPSAPSPPSDPSAIQLAGAEGDAEQQRDGAEAGEQPETGAAAAGEEAVGDRRAGEAEDGDEGDVEPCRQARLDGGPVDVDDREDDAPHDGGESEAAGGVDGMCIDRG